MKFWGFILIFALIISGPACPEVSHESFSERSELVETTLEEAIVSKPVRMVKSYPFKRPTPAVTSYSVNSNPNFLNVPFTGNNRIIQLRKLLI